ncbi:MAG: cysteine desulfurase [Bdellovibrionales bacterium RIFCSPHIGHO2_01_FULL_40_29]|nr:MAG: cysteine desulfurase [Bdellovibrionales bacterium RIFCSPHIGHO2_01_FULL_40_29]OFZ34376.1 MAG: cysteine desulfurase [Bdellovibrionales bacterium RIFCSPHIGHO2_02_FULL_40_15]
MQNEFENTPPQRIYLDHNATTPLSSSLKEKWMELFELWGNPSSIHASSRPGKKHLRESRQKFAEFLGCSPLEIIFNSGASEGNNTILKSVWLERGLDRSEIMISQIEHPSVMKSAEYLKSLGAVLKLIPVSRDGALDLNFVRAEISNRTALISVMIANNETGTVFPIQELSQIAHAHGALMHSDCVQMPGKMKLDFNSLGVDYATFSAHKFYALKGTGIVFAKKSAPWIPLIHGGGQERSRRGGTENILGIASLGIVLDSFGQADRKILEMTRLRDLMEKMILEKIPRVTVTAQKSPRLSNTSSLIIDDADGETMLMSLDLKGFSVSTGAACSSGNPEPSPVLLALGLTRAEAQHSLRISLGWGTDESQIQKFVSTLTEVVEKLRALKKEEKQYAIS